jgi:zinc protease
VTPDEPFRKAPPDLAPFPMPAPPAVHVSKLTNGLTVEVVERPIPSIARVSLVLRDTSVPRGTDPASRAGVVARAYAAIDLILGTKRSTQTELEKAMRDDGLVFYAWRDPGMVGANVTAVTSRIDAAIRILAEVTTEATFPVEALERAKTIDADDRSQITDTPSAVAERVLPLALLGWDYPLRPERGFRADDVRSIKRDAVLSAYEDLFDPSNATLIVVGGEESKVLPMLEAGFGAWRSHKKSTKNQVPPRSELRVGSPRLVVVDRPHSSESSLALGGVCLGFRSADWLAASVATEVFGGPLGRVTRALRDEGNVVVGGHSRLYDAGARDLSLFQWSGSVATSRSGAVARRLFEQLREMQIAEPDAEVFDGARMRHIQSHVAWLSTLTGLSDALTLEATHGMPVEELATFTRRAASVTAKDVQRVSKECFDPSRAKLVIVGDWGELRADLKALGFGPIELRDASGAVLRVETP